MLNRQGWVKIHRQILNNPIVTKDSDHFAIWVFLLLEAQHKPFDKMFKGKKITLKAGQLLTGRKVISGLLNISESKVRRVMKSLESDQQIEQLPSNKCSMITIVKWDVYQIGEQQIEQQVNNNRPTTDQQVTTLQEGKNVNNENKIDMSIGSPWSKFVASFETKARFRESDRVLISQLLIKVTEDRREDFLIRCDQIQEDITNDGKNRYGAESLIKEALLTIDKNKQQTKPKRRYWDAQGNEIFRK